MGGPSTPSIGRTIAPLSISCRSPWPSRSRMRVGLGDVDLAAEQVRVLAVGVPGRVVLEAPARRTRRAGRGRRGRRSSRRRSALVGLEVADQEGVARRRSSPRSPPRRCRRSGPSGASPRSTWASRRPGLDHDLDAGAVAGLQRARLEHREVALGVAEQRPVAPEQGPVEVGVDAAQGGMARTVAAGRSSSGGSRTARSTRAPIAAGIVNVTDDSFYEGARSGTPSRRSPMGGSPGGLRDARRRRGPREERAAGEPGGGGGELIPAVEGLVSHRGAGQRRHVLRRWSWPAAARGGGGGHQRHRRGARARPVRTAFEARTARDRPRRRCR